MAMTTQATTQIEQEEKAGVLAHLLMTALTVALLIGLVLWQVGPGGEKTTAPVAGSAAQRGGAQGSASEGAMPRGGLSERYAEDQRAAPVSERGGLAELFAEQAAQEQTVGPVVYIVESPERAQAVRAAVEQMNAFRATQGQPPLDVDVVSFDSAEAAVQLWETAVAPGIRGAGVGLPYLSVIDLRGGSVAPCPVPEATSSASVPDIC
jgi:hypothetical protein